MKVLIHILVAFLATGIQVSTGAYIYGISPDNYQRDEEDPWALPAIKPPYIQKRQQNTKLVPSTRPSSAIPAKLTINNNKASISNRANINTISGRFIVEFNEWSINDLKKRGLKRRSEEGSTNRHSGISTRNNDLKYLPSQNPSFNWMDEDTSKRNKFQKRARSRLHEIEDGQHSDEVQGFVHILSESGYEAAPVHTYNTPEIFTGASFTLKSDDDEKTLEMLQSMPEVKNAWPVTSVTLMTENFEVPEFQQRYEKDKKIFGENLKNNLESLSSDNMQWYLNEFKNVSASFPRWNPHILTGVEALHNRGLSGNGVTVGIIDTGTWYYDPALGGGFGTGFKVEGGYNFVGDEFDSNSDGVVTPNSNPLDCNGHGTHVAGIVAGFNNSQFMGVAPGATIRSYKIFGCRGGASNDNIIGALLRAYNDGCDIVSLSLGSSGDTFQNNPEGRIIDKLVKNGVFASVAAGNSGSGGAFFGSGLATGKYITAVGSTTTGQFVGYRAKAVSSSGEALPFTYFSTSGIQPSTTGTFTLLQFNDTACQIAKTIPKTNNSQTALLFPQGSCINNDFFHAINGLGYPVALNYMGANDLPAYMSPGGDFDIPELIRGTTDNTLAPWATAQHAKNHTVELVFDNDSLIPRLILNPVDFNGIQLSSFSSWGPDYSGNLYPHVSAPGSDIYSTYLNYSHALLSGTSMATPYISGVAALFIEAARSKNITNYEFIDIGKEIRRRMIQTADPLLMSVDQSSGKYAPLIQQGSGMVNATRLLDTNTTIDSDEYLSLGTAPILNQTFVVTVRNSNSYPVLYNMSHTPATTILTMEPNALVFTLFPPFIYEFANVTFANNNFSINPFSTHNVSVTINIPSDMPLGYRAVYQGRLDIVGDNKESIAVPYIGTRTGKIPIWGDDMPPVLLQQSASTSNLQVVKKNSNASFSDNGLSFLATNLNMGARILDAYIVESNFTLSNVVLPVKDVDAAPGIVTGLSGFPANRVPRVPTGFSVGLALPQNVTIPDGRYRLLYAGLPAVPNIDPVQSVTSDWQTYLSDSFWWSSSNNTSHFNSSSGVNLTSLYIPSSKVSFDMNSNDTQSQNSTGKSNNTLPIPPRLTFTGADITSLTSNQSSYLSPYDTYEISLTLSANNGVVVGDSAIMKLPDEFTTYPAPFPVYNTFGDAIINVTFPTVNGSTFCFATVIRSWNMSYISGGVYFTTFLKNPEKYVNPQFLPLTFVSQETHQAFANILSISPVDMYFPSALARVYPDHSTVSVFIPANFTNWSSLEVVAESAYVVQCEQVNVSAGPQLSLTADANMYFEYTSGCIDGPTHAAHVVFTDPPSPGEHIRIDIPVNTPAHVRNSAVIFKAVGIMNGSNFSYYFTTYLNTENLKSTGLSLSGKY